MLKRFAIAALILALVLLLVWLPSKRNTETQAVVRPATALAEEALPVAALAEGPEREARDQRSEQTLPVESAVSEPAAPMSTASAPAPLPPRSARATLRVKVLDAFSGAPVPRATVCIIGLRPADDAGSEYVIGGQHGEGVLTGPDGKADLGYPAWVTNTGLTCAVDLSVQHPDYAAFRDSSLEVKDLLAEASVELVPGNVLIVSGWIGEASNVVRAVRPQVEDDAQLSASDWVPVGDGRPSTRQLKAGAHVISIAWDSPEGLHYESRVESFELAQRAELELSLELLPGMLLEGELDPQVPRPIEAGEVMVSVEFGGKGGPVSLRTFTTAVGADGRFRFENLPPGRGQAIALCAGWVNVFEQRPAFPAEQAAELEKEWGNLWMRYPSFELPSATILVLPMQRTAVLEVTVVDADGAPVPDATLFVWPNVHWSNGYSSFFLDRTWQAQSDAQGVARLVDLPPESNASYLVEAAGWHMRDVENNSSASAELVSGETTRVTLVLQRD